MQKYYDWNNDKVISIEDVKACYEEFASKKEYETFEGYLECCQDYNNGSLTDLKTYISRLETEMNKSSWPEEREELKLQIEQLKKEL